jgi:carbon storage regulator CsrA
MLVIGRREGEHVIETLPDGRRVRVDVVRVSRDGYVRLGFTAPMDVTVHRGEVQLRIDAELEGGAAGGNEPAA